MIEVKELHKSYGTTEVLKGVNGRISKGDFITIVGASGAGKSTLLHLIAGLDSYNSGSISFDSISLGDLSKKELNEYRNNHIGLVFQFHNLLPELTALENITLPRWISGQMDDSAERKANELLQLLGIEHRAHHLPNEMSGGEQQRVAIARALINEPALLLADEPTGNLDSANAEAVHELLVKLNKELGQTIVVVTHNKELAALGATKWSMTDGKLRE
ncbi:MAG: Lipoprotein-releasing system ATP-binding protein LolD [Cryomorphaceae bacterium]|nr:MAG: Lipoprotein-releasing system ATP-binding protein LolD [Cryomorphaceae bacterium]